MNGKWNFFFIFLLLSGMFAMAQKKSFAENVHNPVADKKSMVTDENVRFTVLTPQMIRMEWSENGKFIDQATLVFLNRRLPVPKFTVTRKNGWLKIQTSHLKLRYKIGSGKFNAKNLQIEFSLNGKSVQWHPGMKDSNNLKGTIRTLDGVKGATDLEPGLISRDGWTLVDDTKRPLLDNSDWQWAQPAPQHDYQDWYFFGYGHNYKQALHDFTRVAGKIPLPPRFVFGVWWSRYWAYTDEEFRQLVHEFEIHDVPLDVLVIDMDWHETFNLRWWRKERDQAGQRKGWSGYTWNKILFPDPKEFLDWCDKKGLKTPLNLHPASGVQPWEEKYPEMARAMGIDPATKKYVPFDIVDKKFAKNYMEILHHPLEKMGVDFWWLDWQQEHKTKIPGVNPTFWLNYVHFTDMERQGKRPLIFHRWGGLGNHRYQIGFSGDAISVWQSLAFQPYFTATASNVLYGYWSHDIGGHMPGEVEPELYTRWIQFGVFSPVLRTHTTRNPKAERRIWAYPVDYFNVMRDAFLLRYAMIPYIYTQARKAYDTGVSLCRPMYYDYPEAEEAYQFKDQYMFGDDLLVAPITEPLDSMSMLITKKIWLPPGEWIEWFTGNILQGGKVIERSFALDEIPVYAKAGAIIPMQPKMRYSNEKPVDPLILTIFPGEKGETQVYEDAGNTLG
ncbi:MAG: alpha-glucosidase, partial [Calditrichaeota bacterium]|nr:alpha-glucosidase [Calditrichota bacterium]